MRRFTLVSNLFTGVALCVALAACGDNKGGGPPGMPGSPASEVVGTWLLDSSSIQKSMNDELAKMPEDQRKAAEPMMKMVLESMKKLKLQVRIESNGTFTGDFPSDDPTKTEVIKGTWKKDGDGIALTSTEKNGAAIEPGSKDAKTVHAKVVGGDLHVTSPEEGSTVLVFKKA